MAKKLRPHRPFVKTTGTHRGGSTKRGITASLPHTSMERRTALEKLDAFVNECLRAEYAEAFKLFWGRFYERERELPSEYAILSCDAEDAWFHFDYELSGGVRVVDEFLDGARLTSGERAFLNGMSKSTLRLYEVIDTVPGESMTLRDLFEDDLVTVRERSGSRTIARASCLAARIIEQGCSGLPEIEHGVLHIPDLSRAATLESVSKLRDTYLRDHPGDSLAGFYKVLPPLLHEVWLASIFETTVPELRNTDGESMVITRISYHVLNEQRTLEMLEAAEVEGITNNGSRRWSWSGKNAAGREVSLGTIELADGILTAEVNSVERGVRVRELLERVCGESLYYRGTTHEDMQRSVREQVVAKTLGKLPDDEGPAAVERLDPDVAEALAVQAYSAHYRAWVDETVPALDNHTPREAAKSKQLRPRVEGMLRQLEGQYEHALKVGQPAYDPSWMWAELGFESAEVSAQPPPLAHERVSARVAGSSDAVHVMAERWRAMPSFDDSSTALDEEAIDHDFGLQRFLRKGRAADNETGTEGSLAAPYIALMVNFELHRRKIFWVDSALAFMLEHTDVDIEGRELRVPFPSFALVLNDRHSLSLGERLLSRHTDDPLCGQILRVATVYVTERHQSLARTLDVTFAFDALGADLPSLVHYDVPTSDEGSIRDFLESLAPRTLVEPPVPDTSPARGLLRLVLNAILYTTSADVVVETRLLAPSRRPPSTTPIAPGSDSVFFLPGKIDISQIRKFQELTRAPGGREQLVRFMVRGHWRRAAKNWTDQRMRWISPYWKGPDMAAVIEKAYRLNAPSQP